MTIKVIETRYKGYRFRSRLEARRAIFFDNVRVKWEYEKEGFHLGKEMYLPDFWLPELECWLEIKGTKPTGNELTLCESLASATSLTVGLFYGMPLDNRGFVYCADCTDGSAGEQWWDEATWAVDMVGRTCLCSGDSFGSRSFLCPESWKPWNGMVQDWYEDKSMLDYIFRAVNAARAARFEHGECG